MRSKKSQGLSITTIIVAAIALIVLVVLISIFTGRFGLFSGGVKEAGTCTSLGGKCQAATSATQNCATNKKEIFGATNCVGTTPFCCEE